jgi:hypothetical protein
MPIKLRQITFSNYNLSNYLLHFIIFVQMFTRLIILLM